MVKKLLSYVKEYKVAAILTPLFMLLEVAMEMVIPRMMASIIDNGVNGGDLNHIFKMGIGMVFIAVVGLFAGVMGGWTGSVAAAGFAKNLRQAQFEKIDFFF